MTEKVYYNKIEAATRSLGVYRQEFTRTRQRLARLYVRIEELDRALAAGFLETVTTDEKGKTDISPEVKELDRLNDQALAYERALGLTADSVRKINENIFTPQTTDAFAAQLINLRRRA